MQSITVQRNKIIVGNNSKSYNDKHPENPISLRPIRDAVLSMPMVKDKDGNWTRNIRKERFIRSFSNLPKQFLHVNLVPYSISRSIS
jgi:hypothetical protein